MINDTMIDDFEKGIKELKDNDAIEQSLALVEIVKDLLDTTKKHLNRVYLLLGISLVVNFLTVGSFLLYESQFEYEATTEEVITTETTDNSVITQEVNGDSLGFSESTIKRRHKKILQKLNKMF
jgi:hypothetical protein